MSQIVPQGENEGLEGLAKSVCIPYKRCWHVDAPLWVPVYVECVEG